SQVVGGDEGSDGGSSRRFSGPISGQYLVTTTTTSQGGTTTCLSTRSITGTLTITLRDGNASGQLETTGSQQEVSFSGAQCSALTGGALPFSRNGDVT